MRIPILKIFNYIGDISGCHQIPERCFKVKGYIFPLCARCTGVMAGQIAAALLLIFKVILPPLWSVILLLIMGADWGVQYVGIKKSTNLRRFITGVGGGLGLFSIYFWLIAKVIGLIVQLW